MAVKSIGQTDPLAISHQERKAIINGVRRSNQLRRDAHLPLINADERYEQEVHALIEVKYRALLKPYLVEAFTQVPNRVGLPGRLSQTMQAWKIASEALYRDKGIADPNLRSMSLVAAVGLYTDSKLRSIGLPSTRI